MADGSDLDSLLGGLEATFSARLARAEEEAVADLAFALRQDRTLFQRVERRPCDVWAADSWRMVSALAPDVVVVGDPTRILIPMRQAVLRASDGSVPSPARPWLSLLRELGRESAQVEVAGLAGASVSGRLVAAAPDHLVVEGRRGWAAVGTGAIAEVRLVRAD